MIKSDFLQYHFSVCCQLFTPFLYSVISTNLFIFVGLIFMLVRESFAIEVFTTIMQNKYP